MSWDLGLETSIPGNPGVENKKLEIKTKPRLYTLHLTFVGDTIIMSNLKKKIILELVEKFPAPKAKTYKSRLKSRYCT